MRNIRSIIPLFALTSMHFAHPESLSELKVTADIQWLLHLDWEHFQGTQIGNCINQSFLNSHREKIKKDIKGDLDFDFDFDKLQSITAFGRDYNLEKGSIFLIRSESELQESFHNLLESKVDEGFGPLKIQPIKSTLQNLYAFAGEFYVAVEPEGLFLLGRSRKQVEEAKITLSESQMSVKKVEAFADYPALSDRPIFFAVAESYGGFAEFLLKYRVLQMSRGARIALCEGDETLLLQADLKTKDKKTSAQIHSILQGILTLTMLSGGDEKMTELAEATSISSQKTIVTMRLELPIERALQVIRDFSK